MGDISDPDQSMFTGHPDGYICRCGLPQSCVCPTDLPGYVIADLIATVKRQGSERLLSVIFGHVGEAPQPFSLYRRSDVTGVSGDGTVALGAQWPDGTVVIRWLGEHCSTVIWPSLDDAMAVHGHDGRTVVVWLSEDLGTLAAEEERAEKAEAALAAVRGHVDALEAWCRDPERGDGQALGGIVAAPRRATGRRCPTVSDDDGLRDELIDALAQLKLYVIRSDNGIEVVAEHIADALLPVVARHVEQARADEQTRIAQAIERHSREPLAGFGPYRLGLRDAAAIARGGDTP